MSADTWAAHQSYNSACVARGAAAAAASLSYEDWGSHHMGMNMNMAAMTHHPHHPSFYHHTAPSPPSSTPSPHNIQQQQQGHLSNGLSSSSTLSNNNNNNSNTTSHSPNPYTPNNNGTSPTFKTEFGPCSGGNQVRKRFKKKSTKTTL
jgi:hypothetical protein